MAPIDPADPVSAVIVTLKVESTNVASGGAD